MNIYLLGVIIFTLSLLTIELSLYAVRIFRHPDRSTVRRRLRESMAEEINANPTIFKQSILSEVPLIHRMLVRLPGMDRLQRVLVQAGVKFTAGFFLFLTLAIGCIGYLLTQVLILNLPLSLLLSLGAAMVPMLYIRSKKRRRMARFEKQLPEALGLIARSLRAGHAFTSGMKLAADEFSDPLGPEFEETLDAINFGLSVPEALKNLMLRVDCQDLKFFVVSVILQRETGGNLAEIIEGLAHLIRERFKFRGKVRVLSTEGKLSAVILYILPFALGSFLFVFHPDVVAPLHTDPIGRTIMWTMGGLLVLGLILIRRIIKVDV